MGFAFSKSALIDLLFRRVFLLFLLAAGSTVFFIDQNALKIKTLNYLIPSADIMRRFADDPSSMSQEELANLQIYYKTVCEFVHNDPEEPAPCGIAGYASYYLGKEKKAIEYYKKSEKLNDRFFWFYFNLGVIYYNQEKYDLAGEQFARALSTPTDHARFFFMLTKTYREISKLLDLKPEDYEASLTKGYDLAKKLYMISQLLAQKPEMRQQINRNKIPLHLF